MGEEGGTHCRLGTSRPDPPCHARVQRVFPFSERPQHVTADRAGREDLLDLPEPPVAS